MADSNPVGFASAAAPRPSKLASPANASVTGWPLPSGLGRVVVVSVEADAVTAGGAGAGGAGCGATPPSEPEETLRPLVEQPTPTRTTASVARTTVASDGLARTGAYRRGERALGPPRVRLTSMDRRTPSGQCRPRVRPSQQRRCPQSTAPAASPFPGSIRPIVVSECPPSRAHASQERHASRSSRPDRAVPSPSSNMTPVASRSSWTCTVAAHTASSSRASPRRATWSIAAPPGPSRTSATVPASSIQVPDALLPRGRRVRPSRRRRIRRRHRVPAERPRPRPTRPASASTRSARRRASWSSAGARSRSTPR